jgi:hypothetical protein
MTEAEKRIFDMVRSNLKTEFVAPAYRNLVDSPFCGHCHHATVAMYNLLGGKTGGYKIRKAVDERAITHYWLESPTGEIIDPTAEQYSDLNRPLPYDKAVSKGVSYRKTTAAKIIIEAVASQLNSG